MAGMKARPAILLDITRLVSRIGQGPLTGIDRVEAEWLAELADRPHLLLCRLAGGRQALLPSDAGRHVLRWVAGDLSGLPAAAGWRERLRGQAGLTARAHTALREMAVCPPRRHGRGYGHFCLKRLPENPAYLNVGHSNLAPQLLNNLHGVTRVVMIHDTIPLDHPEFTRPEQTPRFRRRLIAALTHADLIVAISDATAARVAWWSEKLSIPKIPHVITAHIGTRLTPADSTDNPVGFDLSKPFFVTLGTIEPRKNHALLLDTWDELSRRLPAEQIPRLLILGRRGWENRDVFARLDRLPGSGPVSEHGNLTDATVAALIAQSHGLLMPSRAEGFGLPLTEAAGRGVAVLCTPLPSAREILGDYAIYLSPDRPQDWADAVSSLAAKPRLRMNPLEIPTWQRHFELVNDAIASIRASNSELG